MHPRSALRHALLVLPVAFAGIALANANPAPITRLQPGLWQFHYRSVETVDGYSHPVLDSSTTRCITAKDTDPGKLPLMPKLPANIQCTAPQLQTLATGYHVTMACTAHEPNGMVSSMRDAFTINPSDDGSAVQFTGVVHQKLTGAPIPIPPVRVQITAQGHRIGLCPATAKG